jgi:hypothetical protein
MRERRHPSRQRPAKVAALLAATIIIIGGGFLFAPYLLFQKPSTVASVVDTQTPHALIKNTAFMLPAHQRACLSSVTVTPNSRLARFQPNPVSGAKHGGPPLALLLSAPGYRTVGQLEGGYEGSEGGKGREKPKRAESSEERALSERTARVPREGEAVPEYGEKERRIIEWQFIPITPPHAPVIGTACFINEGRTPVLLDGTSESRLASRSTMTIGGSRAVGTVELTFLDERHRARLSHVGEVFEHASNLTDRLVPVWLIWIITVAAILAIPAGIVAAFYRGLREDEVAEAP